MRSAIDFLPVFRNTTIVSKKRKFRLGPYTRIDGFIVLNLFLAIFVFFLSYLHSHTAPSQKSTNDNVWLPYRWNRLLGHGSSLFSFKYPSTYHLDAYTDNQDEKQVEMSFQDPSHTDPQDFTIDLFTRKNSDAANLWLFKNYKRSQPVTINTLSWTFITSKDCNNPQACASDDVYYLADETDYQVLFHFLATKEMTRTQRDILSTVRFRNHTY